MANTKKKKSVLTKLSKNITKKKSSQSKSLFFSRKGYSRQKMVALILVFVAIGGVIIYKSFASSTFVGISQADEQDQVNRINNTRSANGLPHLEVANCIKTVEESYVQTEVATGVAKDINPTVFLNACGVTAGGGLANTASIGNPCTGVGDSCSATLFTNLMNSPGHRANILSSGVTIAGTRFPTKYLGVGTYRTAIGSMFVTQGFIECNCLLAWTLSGSAAVSTGGGNLANTSVKAGTAVVWHHVVANNGPDTASFPEHIDSYHYNKVGVTLSSSQIQAAGISLAAGTSRDFPVNATIPTSATVGDRYCHQIYYASASGAGTAAAVSSMSCVTVIK